MGYTSKPEHGETKKVIIDLNNSIVIDEFSKLFNTSCGRDRNLLIRKIEMINHVIDQISVKPCTGKSNLLECFTIENGKVPGTRELKLWFVRQSDNNTGLLIWVVDRNFDQVIERKKSSLLS